MRITHDKSKLSITAVYIALLALSTSTTTLAQQLERPDPTGPLASHSSLILDAAKRSLDIYSLSAGESDDLFLTSTGPDGNNELSTVWFRETSDFCYATFRAKTDGQGNERFNWIANMDLAKSHIKSKTSGKKCRVVAEYQKLYMQRASYRLQLEARLDACAQADKLIVLAGHGLGGALALLVGVRYDQTNPWIVTFGQPPIFMPAAYTEVRAINSGDARENPCRLVNPKRYVPFVNAHSYVIDPDDATFNSQQTFDFLFYLNELVYGMIVYSRDDLPTSSDTDITSSGVTMPCLLQAQEHVQRFLNDDAAEGNLGSQYGSTYYLPTRSSPLAEGANRNRVGILYLRAGVRRKGITFDSSTRLPVEMSMLLTEAMTNDENFCDFTAGDENLLTHSMQAYHDKLVEILDFGFTEDGYEVGMQCSFDRECFKGFAECSSVEKMCIEKGGRPNRNANCVGFRAGCVASSQCCSGFACIAGQCQGCLGLMQNCASGGECCTGICNGMRMMKCKG